MRALLICQKATSGASLVAQLVKNLPAVKETPVQSLGGEDPLGKIPWRRELLPTPVFWPGESHALYGPWGCKELDTTERLSLSNSVQPGVLHGGRVPTRLGTE